MTWLPYGVRLSAKSCAPRLRIGSNYLMHFSRPQSARTWDYSGLTARKDTLSREASRFLKRTGIFIVCRRRHSSKQPSEAECRTALHPVPYNRQDIIPEPRASIRYQCSDRVTFKASYTEMSQFMHQLSNTYLNLPMDFGYLPPKVAPMRSRTICGRDNTATSARIG